MTKALFLDRDGIINVDHGYVYKKEDFEFVDGIFELCKLAVKKDYLIFVITNQSGIARGKYTVAQFEELSDWMKSEFKLNGIIIEKVYFCPHHPTKGKEEFLKACSCRKPEPGMIIQASTEYSLDLKESIFIGDKTSDMQAAEAAGIHNRILVASQYKENTTITAHRVTKINQASSFID
jgi:D-glycero-D-manno-heptose 1,7-bisphosphate phosphatase